MWTPRTLRYHLVPAVVGRQPYRWIPRWTGRTNTALHRPGRCLGTVRTNSSTNEATTTTWVKEEDSSLPPSTPPQYAILLDFVRTHMPAAYLHAAVSVDPHTWQRTDAVYDPTSGAMATTSSSLWEQRHHHRPMITLQGRNNKEPVFLVTWPHDGTEEASTTTHMLSLAWVQRHYDAWVQQQQHQHDKQVSSSITTPTYTFPQDRNLWQPEWDESGLREAVTMSFDDVVMASTHNHQRNMLATLYQYGVVLLQNTPVQDPAALSALSATLSGGAHTKTDPQASLLPAYQARRRQQPDDNEDDDGTLVLPYGSDGPLRTLYGTVWSTAADVQQGGGSTADSAYSNEALPLHTDMTYYQTPPGLQIFGMRLPATGDGGGATVLGDGYAAAVDLYRHDAAAYQRLATTPRRYHCRDDTTGWHLQATGPIFQHDPLTGRLQTIRHNDLDRLPDGPYYENDITNDGRYTALEAAHTAWNTCLNQHRTVVHLRAGETLVVDNHRVMHGRTAFTGARAVVGCYVSYDDLQSRWRQLGLIPDGP